MPEQVAAHLLVLSVIYRALQEYTNPSYPEREFYQLLWQCSMIFYTDILGNYAWNVLCIITCKSLCKHIQPLLLFSYRNMYYDACFVILFSCKTYSRSLIRTSHYTFCILVSLINTIKISTTSHHFYFVASNV